MRKLLKNIWKGVEISGALAWVWQVSLSVVPGGVFAWSASFLGGQWLWVVVIGGAAFVASLAALLEHRGRANVAQTVAAPPARARQLSTTRARVVADLMAARDELAAMSLGEVQELRTWWDSNQALFQRTAAELYGHGMKGIPDIRPTMEGLAKEASPASRDQMVSEMSAVIARLS